jgi:hypothetical protein
MVSENRFNVVDSPSLVWPFDVSIPTKRFRLFVAADTKTASVDAVSTFTRAALEKGMVYFCGWGAGLLRRYSLDGENFEHLSSLKVTMVRIAPLPFEVSNDRLMLRCS